MALSFSFGKTAKRDLILGAIADAFAHDRITDTRSLSDQFYNGAGQNTVSAQMENLVRQFKDDPAIFPVVTNIIDRIAEKDIGLAIKVAQNIISDVNRRHFAGLDFAYDSDSTEWQPGPQAKALRQAAGEKLVLFGQKQEAGNPGQALDIFSGLNRHPFLTGEAKAESERREKDIRARFERERTERLSKDRSFWTPSERAQAETAEAAAQFVADLPAVLARGDAGEMQAAAKQYNNSLDFKRAVEKLTNLQIMVEPFRTLARKLAAGGDFPQALEAEKNVLNFAQNSDPAFKDTYPVYVRELAALAKQAAATGRADDSKAALEAINLAGSWSMQNKALAKETERAAREVQSILSQAPAPVTPAQFLSRGTSPG